MRFNTSVFSGTFILAFMMNGATLANDSVVSIALPSWDAGKIIAHDLAALVKDNTDLNVEFVEMEGDVIWAELANENGKIDVFPDIWLPNQQSHFDKYVVENSSVFANTVPYNGDQGFYAILPGKLSMSALKIEDLLNPVVISAFDTDKNGKGELWPGAEGWHSTLHSQVKMKDYELTDSWELIAADNAEFQKILDQRAESGQGLLFYYWEPEAVQAKHPTIKVKETEFTDGCQQFIEPKDDADWLKKSSFKCAYQVATVHILFTRDIAEHAILGPIFKDYTIDVAKLQSAMLMLKEKQSDLLEAAETLR